jgi:hypothetical protein
MVTANQILDSCMKAEEPSEKILACARELLDTFKANGSGGHYHSIADLPSLTNCGTAAIEYIREPELPKGTVVALTGDSGSGKSTVAPVNSGQFDKLGFVAHQSFAFRTGSNGLFRLPQRLVSEPCGPPVGDPGLTSSARSASELGQAPEVEPC